MSKASDYASKAQRPKIELRAEDTNIIEMYVTDDGNLSCDHLCDELSPQNALKLRDWLTDTFEEDPKVPKTVKKTKPKAKGKKKK